MFLLTWWYLSQFSLSVAMLTEAGNPAERRERSTRRWESSHPSLWPELPDCGVSVIVSCWALPSLGQRVEESFLRSTWNEEPGAFILQKGRTPQSSERAVGPFQGSPLPLSIHGGRLSMPGAVVAFSGEPEQVCGYCILYIFYICSINIYWYQYYIRY